MTMNRIFFSFALVLLLTGCTSTRSVITEFDSAGKVIKTTETQQSVISSVVESTKDKTVIIWEDGWAAYISASSGTTEDPTPHGKIFCGQVNKGVLSIHKEHLNITGIAEVINATKSNVTVNAQGASSSRAAEK